MGRISYYDIVKEDFMKQKDGFGSGDRVCHIMRKDVCVASVSLGTGEVTVREEGLLPFSCKFSDDGYRNRNVFDEWCAGRILPLSKKYAKKVYNLLAISQDNSTQYRASVSRSYSCLSLQDCFWVKMDGSSKVWSEVNLYKNSLHNALLPISLKGESFTLKGDPRRSPDVETEGTYAKAWVRDSDGLVLLKPDDSAGSDEVGRECLASYLISCFNVNVLNYKEIMYDGVRVSACRCMTGEERSIVTFNELKKRYGSAALGVVRSVDPDGYYKMIVATYLVGNSDLHDRNWGMFYNPDTMKLIRVFDLFDFNNAFDPSEYGKLEGGSCIPLMKVIDLETGREVTGSLEDINFEIVEGPSMLEAAREAIGRCSFRQLRPIDWSRFGSDAVRQHFKERCSALGIEPK